MPEPTSSATIIIPVWNGAGVLSECLAAVYAHSGPRLAAVVAVDNGSSDASATGIAQAFPQVQLIRQPYNLGFAGGVNAGMAAADGDTFVLLNQDCVVETGWLDALLDGMAGDADAAIAGCTIFNPDGTVNHAGARLEPPLAYSHHFTTRLDAPARMEYVTGAVFAVRRTAWARLGPLDADFYPAYYEEADYCYRARRHGLGVLYVPQAAVRHLQSSRAWRADPLLHSAQQHRARYRFVAKHFAGELLAAFFPAECSSLETEAWFDQAMGRALAARHLLRGLDATLLRRQHELGDSPTPADGRRLQVEFAALERHALERAQLLAQRNYPESLLRRVRRRLGLLGQDLDHRPPGAAQRAAQVDVLDLLAKYDYR